MILDRTGRESHPAADLFPMMGDEELRALAADIKERGLVNPIVIHGCNPATGAPLILDGRNRLRACEMAGVMPDFKQFDCYSERSPVLFVLGQNLHRRHLTDTQRKMIAAEAAKRHEAEAKQRQREAGGDRRSLDADRHRAIADAGRSTEKAAAKAGVSPREVAKAKRVIEKAPVLADAVAEGKASLDAAAALADEPAEKQRELVAQGPRAIKEAAREKRSRARREPAPARPQDDRPARDDAPARIIRGGSALCGDDAMPGDIAPPISVVSYDRPDPQPSAREQLLERFARCVDFARHTIGDRDELVARLGDLLEDLDVGGDVCIAEMEARIPPAWDGLVRRGRQ